MDKLDIKILEDIFENVNSDCYYDFLEAEKRNPGIWRQAFKLDGAIFIERLEKLEKEKIENNLTIELNGMVDIQRKKDSFHYAKLDEVGRVICNKDYRGNKYGISIIPQGEIKITEQSQIVTDGIKYFNGYNVNDFNTDKKLFNIFKKPNVDYSRNNWFAFEIFKEDEVVVDIVVDSGALDVCYDLVKAINYAKEELINFLKKERR